MTTEKKCSNCAWFCHADGRCYAHQIDMDQAFKGYKWHIPEPDWSYYVDEPERKFCSLWTFDGLEQWERDACEPALMTMEAA